MKPGNSEFRGLFEVSGWKAAEAARRLHVTAATISRYLDPDPEQAIEPSRPVIELFKIILANEKSEVLSAVAPGGRALEDWEVSVLEELRRLEVSDRGQLVRIIGQIARLAKGDRGARWPEPGGRSAAREDRAGAPPVSSGAVTAEQAEAIAAAERAVENEPRAPRSSPRARGPSGGTSGPSGGTLRGSKGPRPSPRGRAPK